MIVYGLTLSSVELVDLRIALASRTEQLEKHLQKTFEEVSAKENSYTLLAYKDASERMAAHYDLVRKVELLLK